MFSLGLLCCDNRVIFIFSTDINECFLRGGHGPCQDECQNTEGSYKCSCGNLKGTVLAKDNHSCEQIDSCSVNNGGCSHICLDTIGNKITNLNLLNNNQHFEVDIKVKEIISFITQFKLGRTYCSCPEGWQLDEDWKTCVDIDECQMQDKLELSERCSYECTNTVGSYRCVEFGADQPDVDYLDLTVKNEIELEVADIKDDNDGTFELIEGAQSVFECTNGFYFNETISNCQGA